ncbi:MAG: hypothetical protein SLAVMIC_00300 [uncultured marine phage]|uniref:Uncharacterized protein n=1 Tax=uncultured marine phage TaxID=707152 RepID=A0A8D9FS13_9VIRU|nr:MAG: hypothetical protein SLAVMIC_00300 [uncultured marine phage]
MLDPKNYIENKFESTKRMGAWWGSILQEGKEYSISEHGIRDVWIYTDYDAYWDGFPDIPKFKNRSEMTPEEIEKEEEEGEVRSQIFKDLKNKYKMKIRASYVVIDGDDAGMGKQKETFFLESVEDIIEKYDLDKSKKVDFTGTHNIFREWSNDKSLHREIRFKKLLDE